MYTVRYKYRGGLRWRTLRHIIADGIVPGVPVRYFITSDKTRIEIPVSETEFRFPPERMSAIEEDVRKEAGH